MGGLKPIWMFPKIVGFTPPIICFYRVFHYKPSILGYPCCWKHPYHIYPPGNLDISLPFDSMNFPTSPGVICDGSLEGTYERMHVHRFIGCSMFPLENGIRPIAALKIRRIQIYNNVCLHTCFLLYNLLAI